MPAYSAITYELTGSVATITLNRPEAANSLNETLSSEMLDAIIRSEENTEVRALMISGGPAASSAPARTCKSSIQRRMRSRARSRCSTSRCRGSCARHFR